MFQSDLPAIFQANCFFRTELLSLLKNSSSRHSASTVTSSSLLQTGKVFEIILRTETCIAEPRLSDSFYAKAVMYPDSSMERAMIGEPHRSTVKMRGCLLRVASRESTSQLSRGKCIAVYTSRVKSSKNVPVRVERSPGGARGKHMGERLSLLLHADAGVKLK